MGILNKTTTALNQMLNMIREGVTTISFGDDSANNTEFDEDGHIRMNGGAIQWTDLRVPVSATEVNGSNPPLEALFKNDGNEIPGTAYALSFLSTAQGNLTLPDNVNFDTSADFTFEFWVRPTVNTQNNIEVVRKQNVFEIDFVGSNQLNLNIIGVGSSTGSLQFNRGGWNHILIVHDATAGEISMYLNNQLNITISGSVADDITDFVFNRRETLFDIDYIAYWDTALNASAISARYASGSGDQLAGNEIGLKGLWELNNGSGTSVVEKTGLATNGSITGGSEGSQWDWIGGHVGNTSPGSRGVILKYFNPDTPSELYFTAQLPHGYEEGTDTKPHVHWVANSNGGASEDVVWGLEYTWINIGEVFGDTVIITGDTNNLSETLVKDKHYITNLGTIDGTGKKFSSMLICRIFRDAESVDDTFTDFAGLLEVDFHYQIDSFGSNLEFIKR